ncbi:DUF6807 domain-containing protein [Arachidicoccus terrestris]|uniref:DUF6807 domain-containing protein n=1 Tax=Arachidicoccus terrestris TaxID=2875539 RepID=UPI001CC81591|nr:PmoA family protein [Arachidicoccus terrestris]UAY56982.1 PmoA family protein [Arachidicoccus terrestris]
MTNLQKVRGIMVIGLLLLSELAVTGYAQDTRFTITENKTDKRVDISIDGKPFTSYIYPDSLMKPVLYPIRTADGAWITRGWPLVPRAGEHVDHPHHIGLWFNYENVDGLDFWNNSSSIPKAKKKKYGEIRHFSVNKMFADNNKAELGVTAYWITPDGTKLLRQDTKYIFSGTGSMRSIEIAIKLTALSKDVSFPDIKDGLIGIRLTRELEYPSDIPEKVTDSNGVISGIQERSIKEETGVYRSSEGKEGNAVWGTRARWVNLNGTLGGEPVSVVILDHPANIGFPTYWHARGYGLFAANPLGQKIFSNGKKALDFKIKAGTSAVFKYKVLINSGRHLSDDQVNNEANEFKNGAN